LVAYLSHLLLLHTDFGLERATELYYTFLGVSAVNQVIGNFGVFFSVLAVSSLVLFSVALLVPLLASDEIRSAF